MAQDQKGAELLEVYKNTVSELDKNISVSRMINQGDTASMLQEADYTIDMLMVGFAKVANGPCAESTRIILSDIKEYRNKYPSTSVLANDDFFLRILKSIKPIDKPIEVGNKLEIIKQRLTRLKKRNSCDPS